MPKITSIIARFSKIPVSVIVMTVICILFISISFDDNDHDSFIELPVVEALAADNISYATDNSDEQTSESSEKERKKVLEDLIASLNEEKKNFELKKKELEIKEDNLKSVKREIEDKLAQMQLLKAEVTVMIKQQEAANEVNIKKLAKVYESAPPQQAGLLLSNIDVDIAAKILLKMNSRKAGVVWGFVEAKKAALISKKLAKYNTKKSVKK